MRGIHACYRCIYCSEQPFPGKDHNRICKMWMQETSLGGRCNRFNDGSPERQMLENCRIMFKTDVVRSTNNWMSEAINDVKRKLKNRNYVWRWKGEKRNGKRKV